MRKLARLMVFLSAALLLFTACSGSNGSNGSNGSTSPSAGESGNAETNSASNTGSSGEADGDSREKMELDFMFYVQSANVSFPSADKDFVKSAIEEKFNVELNLDYAVLGEEYDNKLNLKIASGDTPDFFHADPIKSVKYMEDGVVVDMPPYVNPQTMPNYFKYWVTEEELARYQSSGFSKRGAVPFAKERYNSYYIRKDWLDALNLQMPKTYAELLEVMKAFTTRDPDGNGKNDTFGFTTAGQGTSVPLEFPAFFDGVNLGAFFYIEGDQFVDGQSDIRAGEALGKVKEMIDLGIVDPDWFLNKPAQVLEKAQTGKVGVFMSGVRDIAFDNSPNSIQKKTKEITGVQTADWQPFHIAADTGVAYKALPFAPFYFSAKSSEAEIRRITEILEWLGSEEGFLLTHYGQEGVHYTRSGNDISVNPEAYEKDIVDNGNFLEIYGSIFAYNLKEVRPFGLQVVDPRETDRDREILNTVTGYKLLELGTNLLPVPNTDLGAFRTKMREYHVNMVLKEADTSNWPAYRKDLMDNYQGKLIFEGYAEQVGNAVGRTITFASE